MFNNRGRLFAGLLIAVAIPAVVGALATPASALTNADHLLAQTCTNIPNLIANCGFETTTSVTDQVPGWNHVVDDDAFTWTTDVHSGTHSLAFGSGGTDDVLTQTVKVAPHTTYLIGAWIDAVGGGANDFALAATNIAHPDVATTIYSESNAAAGWHQIGGTVTTSSGTTMTVVLRGANPPAHTSVDDVTLIAVPSGCAPIANDLVRNCGFENGTPGPWVEPGTDHASGVFADDAWGGTQALRFASTTVDDTWQQVLSTRPKTQYTISYWVEYWNRSGTPVNDLHVTVSNVPAAVGGKLRVDTKNIANHFWTHVTKTFTTGTGSGAVLSIAGANKPGWTYVDDVSVTAVPHVKITHSGRVVTVTLNGVGGQKVYLEKLVGSHWVITHTWIAPKTGYTKSWALTVSSGGAYRAVAAAAPGYASSVAGPIAIK